MSKTNHLSLPTFKHPPLVRLVATKCKMKLYPLEKDIVLDERFQDLMEMQSKLNYYTFKVS